MGKCKDYGLSIGDVIPSNKTGEYEVLSFEKGSKVRLRSLSCDNEVILRTHHASKGMIGNKMFPTFFGKGYLGEGKYKTRESTTAPKNIYYVTWENMLARCYYPKTSRYSAYGGKGVTVCEEWLNFQNFASWFEENYVDGWHLDKDILGDGMEYNPNVCRFIPQEVNGLLVNNTINIGKRSDLPVGVYYNKKQGIYQCTININRVKGQVFRSNSIEEVKKFYSESKTRSVREVVERYKDTLPKDIYIKLSNYEFKYEEK